MDTDYTLVKPLNFNPWPLPGRDAWLKALRSGEFKQGQQKLTKKYNNGEVFHCCLGVLCALQQRPIAGTSPRCNYLALVYDNDSGTLSSSNPLFRYLQGAGTFPPGCLVIYDSGLPKAITSLVTCNDELKLTFNQIADIIEQLWYEPDIHLAPYPNEN